MGQHCPKNGPLQNVIFFFLMSMIIMMTFVLKLLVFFLPLLKKNTINVIIKRSVVARTRFYYLALETFAVQYY